MKVPGSSFKLPVNAAPGRPQVIATVGDSSTHMGDQLVSLIFNFGLTQSASTDVLGVCQATQSL